MKRLLVVALLVGFLVVLFVSPVYASASGEGGSDFLTWLSDLLIIQWPALIGIAALITVIVNVLKGFGWVKDGYAQAWSAGLNLLGMIILIGIKVVRPDLGLEFLDGTAGMIASVLTVFSGLLIQVVSSYLLHRSIAGIPVIGKSFSLEEIKKLASDPDQFLGG